MADVPYVHLLTREEWRAWLTEHHATESSVWTVHWRSGTGRPRIAYSDLVEEALCFGWVDGQAATLDEERSAQYMSRRKKGGTWARTNKERVARLIADGLMTPAGMAVVEQAKADGSWTLLDSVEALEVPDDLAAALDADGSGRARAVFEAFTPSRRKGLLWWVASAKRPATRAGRIEQIVRSARDEGLPPPALR